MPTRTLHTCSTFNYFFSFVVSPLGIFGRATVSPSGGSTYYALFIRKSSGSGESWPIIQIANGVRKSVKSSPVKSWEKARNCIALDRDSYQSAVREAWPSEDRYVGMSCEGIVAERAFKRELAAGGF